jgi:hypothetical protein
MPSFQELYQIADHLPKLAPGHRLRVPFLFKLLYSEEPVPYFDLI